MSEVDAVEQSELRQLPESIVIPDIRGEMVYLRPANVEDLACLDELEAFYNASSITGKDYAAERAVVHTWVRRSVAWRQGLPVSESGVGDPESRRTIAWAIEHGADVPESAQLAEQLQVCSERKVIGMIFLIDIDGWARSARIQVVLGKDYRGRGYSRDAMPRVMTYGFANQPIGLQLHRIWVAVPEKNTRSLSVYQSLGFMPAGVSRDALWDQAQGKYQDLHVMDSLVDEYDPIRSLDAFGMHVIDDNPGIQEALLNHEHSMAIRQRRHESQDLDHGVHHGTESAESFGGTAVADLAGAASAGLANAGGSAGIADDLDAPALESARAHEQHGIHNPQGMHHAEGAHNLSGADVLTDTLAADLTADLAEKLAGDQEPGSQQENIQDAGQSQQQAPSSSSWPFSALHRKKSKQAWWRTLGYGRNTQSQE